MNGTRLEKTHLVCAVKNRSSLKQSCSTISTRKQPDLHRILENKNKSNIPQTKHNRSSKGIIDLDRTLNQRQNYHNYRPTITNPGHRQQEQTPRHTDLLISERDLAQNKRN